MIMIMIMDVIMAGHPRPMSVVFFFFSFPHLIVSWLMYACQLIGVSFSVLFNSIHLPQSCEYPQC